MAIEPATASRSAVHVETWGEGTPVVLVHGSLAVGAEEWEAQRPLADEGFRLVVLDRRGHGQSPVVRGEDYLVDANDVVDLMGDGAHLVGHSYGGLSAMLAAARRPDATLSLTLLEAPAAVAAEHAPTWRSLVEEVGALWSKDLPDGEWVVRFLELVGSDPAELPPELLATAAPLTPVFRRGRPFFDFVPPVAELAVARFPKLVASGGHSPAFEEMCDALARSIGAARVVAEGAGHEVQFAAPAINDALLALWRSAGEPFGRAPRV